MTAPTVIISTAAPRGCDGRLRDAGQPFAAQDEEILARADAPTVRIPRSELGLVHRRVRADFADEIAALDTDLAVFGARQPKPLAAATPHRRLAILILHRALHWTAVQCLAILRATS